MGLTGCGVKDKTKKSGFTEPYLDEDMAAMTKQDQSCAIETLSAQDSVNAFEVTQWLNGQLFWKVVDIRDYLLPNRVLGSKNYIISKVKYGGRAKRVDSLTYNSTIDAYILMKAGEPKVLEDTKDLDLCPGTTEYKRYTYENAGITVTKTVDKTFNAVKAALPELVIESITVNITPAIEVIHQYRGGLLDKKQIVNFEVDNAFYNPSEQSVNFLPQGETRKSEGKQPLWEVPMVASHEFGHHIFQQTLKDKVKAEASSVVEHCFLDEHQHKQVLGKASERDNTYKFALRSLNEAFADLISLYTLDDDEISLVGFKCFENTREPESRKTYNGQDKAFSFSGRQKMDSEELASISDPSCNDINFQRVHSVGSIAAHHIDALYTQLNLARSKKLKYLLLWLDKMAASFEDFKKQKPSFGLFMALELAYLTALENEGQSLQNKCKDLRVAFPASTFNYSCKFLK